MAPPRDVLLSEELIKTCGRAGLGRQVASTVLPTRWGIFQMLGFERETRRSGPKFETAVVLKGTVTYNRRNSSQTALSRPMCRDLLKKV
jgi:hypothetical protein